MNELIEQLAEQAGFENGHQDRNGNSLSDELEKFAELIVQECADLCLKYETCEDMDRPLEHRKGRHFYTIIKKHFGYKSVS
jgi:hypothetical protein